SGAESLSWLNGLARRNRQNRLQDAARHEIRIGGRVRTTVFEISLIVVLDEAVRHPDRRTAVGDAIRELVDRLRFVKTRETEMILRPVDGDVLVHMLVESRHELLEVGFASDFTHELRREVRVHAGTVPIKRLVE